MRKQFIMLIATGILLILGWTIVEYKMQSLLQQDYDKVSAIPVIIYSWDKPVMDSLQVDLKQFDFIKEVKYSTGQQSTQELIKKYGFTGLEDILEDDNLPDILTIFVTGDAHTRASRLHLKTRLDQHPAKERLMVQYMDDICSDIFKRIDSNIQFRWILIGFIGLVIFLIFLLKRLHYEHHLARVRHLIRTKQKEGVRIHEHFWVNSLLLWFLPLGISFLLYNVLFYNDWLLYRIPVSFFLIQLGTVVLATLVAYPFVVNYKHEAILGIQEGA